ncbi:hypothetical protein NL529_31930, partial [Klebsiella pneumoniae]|nr:hypothetical protein [Klebsiella pneumoniae]
KSPDGGDDLPDVPVFSKDADDCSAAIAAFRKAALSLAGKEHASISLRIDAVEMHKVFIDKAIVAKDLTCLHAFLPLFFSATAN